MPLQEAMLRDPFRPLKTVGDLVRLLRIGALWMAGIDAHRSIAGIWCEKFKEASKTRFFAWHFDFDLESLLRINVRPILTTLFSLDVSS